MEVQPSTEQEMAVKLPKKNKGTVYYYRHREEILEKQRLARLAKKGVDITKIDSNIQTPLEERRKKKMEFLGLLKTE